MQDLIELLVYSMDAAAAKVEPVTENGGRDVAQAVVEVEIDLQTGSEKPSFVPAAVAEENGAESELEDKKPPGILKTPQLQSFEDGIQHTVEPQMLDEEEPIKKYNYPYTV